MIMDYETEEQAQWAIESFLDSAKSYPERSDFYKDLAQQIQKKIEERKKAQE